MGEGNSGDVTIGSVLRKKVAEAEKCCAEERYAFTRGRKRKWVP